MAPLLAALSPIAMLALEGVKFLIDACNEIRRRSRAVRIAMGTVSIPTGPCFLISRL